MSTLYFRLGTESGFTAETAASSSSSINVPIRELVQNALDASLAANNQIHSVAIDIVEVASKDIPHLKEYEQALDQAVKTHEKKKSYNQNSRNRVQKLKDSLAKDKHKVLICTDNGKGMETEDLDALLSCSSREKDDGQGGSYGVGHQTALWMSDLDYVLYATKNKGGGRRTLQGKLT